MIPNASEITRRRLTASMLIRMLAVLVLHGSMVPIIIMSVLIVDGEISGAGHDWFPFIIAAAIPASIAVTVWCLAPWVARLMIRVPRLAVCPACQFKLDGLMAPQCTECGYTLTPEFLTSSTERSADVREPDTVLLRQIATLVLRLVSGALVPIAGLSAFAMAADAIEHPEWSSWTPVFAWMGILVISIGVVVCASSISIVFVPGRARFQKRADPGTPSDRIETVSTPLDNAT